MATAPSIEIEALRQPSTPAGPERRRAVYPRPRSGLVAATGRRGDEGYAARSAPRGRPSTRVVSALGRRSVRRCHLGSRLGPWYWIGGDRMNPVTGVEFP